jgi:hypothetical protein
MAGCNTLSTACTLIACESGLTVQLADPRLPDAYTVELELPDGTTLVRSCGATACGSTVFFADVTPATAVVRFVVDDEVRHQQTVTPAYTTERPNGPGCPPVCRQGTATVQVPG